MSSKITSEFFDKCQTMPLMTTITDIDCSIDSSKLAICLAQLSENKRAFLSTLVDKMIYRNHERFLSDLVESFNIFATVIGTQSFWILTPNGFDSSCYCISLLWNRIKQHNFSGFVTCCDQVEPNQHVAIIDDASFTGFSLHTIIDEFGYRSETKNVGGTRKSINLHIVIPYMSIASKTRASQLSTKKNLCNFYDVETLPTLCEKGALMLPTYEYEVNKNYVYPFYLNHKMANNFGILHTLLTRGNVSAPFPKEVGNVSAPFPKEVGNVSAPFAERVGNASAPFSQGVGKWQHGSYVKATKPNVCLLKHVPRNFYTPYLEMVYLSPVCSNYER